MLAWGDEQVLQPAEKIQPNNLIKRVVPENDEYR